MLTEGPCAIYNQLLMLQRYKLGTSPDVTILYTFFTWMRFVKLPFLCRNEEDIRLFLKDVLLMCMVKPQRNHIVPTEGYKVLINLELYKRIPFDINIEDDNGQSMVNFLFERLPPQYYQQCQKIGHQVVVWKEEQI